MPPRCWEALHVIGFVGIIRHERDVGEIYSLQGSDLTFAVRTSTKPGTRS
jgi:hypothetical protein